MTSTASLTTPEKSPISIAPILGASKSVPGRPGDLQAQYAQRSIALEESLATASYHLHGPSPTSHRVSSPDVAPLVLIQQRCVDPCPGRFRSPSHDSSRTIDAYSSHHRFSRRSHERYDQRVAYSDAPAH